jgi:hypothetical protein
MANVAFLFPGSGPYDALDHWVWALARHAKRHRVALARTPSECAGADLVLPITETNSYPRHRLEANLAELAHTGVPFGVLHNNDRALPDGRSGVPEPGGYPSFCWTRRGRERLRALGHDPVLLRQPVFPPLVPPPGPGAGLLAATFGHVEPKKATFAMWEWARKRGVPFWALGPDVHAADNADYVEGLRRRGCNVTLYPWLERVEGLAPLVARVSHFLFVLLAAKGGTGGSPTSPRYAGFFNRPVIVIDDEDTFRSDSYHVFESLDALAAGDLPHLGPPSYAWGPDEYLDALAEKTLSYRGNR